MLKFDNSAGKKQTQAIYNVIFDWNFEGKLQILCYDTTTLNIGRIDSICIALEQKFNRELLIFA